MVLPSPSHQTASGKMALGDGGSVMVVADFFSVGSRLRGLGARHRRAATDRRHTTNYCQPSHQKNSLPSDLLSALSLDSSQSSG